MVYKIRSLLSAFLLCFYMFKRLIKSSHTEIRTIRCAEIQRKTKAFVTVLKSLPPSRIYSDQKYKLVRTTRIFATLIRNKCCIYIQITNLRNIYCDEGKFENAERWAIVCWQCLVWRSRKAMLEILKLHLLSSVWSLYPVFRASKGYFGNNVICNKRINYIIIISY